MYVRGQTEDYWLRLHFYLCLSLSVVGWAQQCVVCALGGMCS